MVATWYSIFGRTIFEFVEVDALSGRADGLIIIAGRSAYLDRVRLNRVSLVERWTLQLYAYIEGVHICRSFADCRGYKVGVVTPRSYYTSRLVH